MLQPIVGLVLDAHWAGEVVNGTRVYPLAAWQWGFATMLGWGLLALVLLAVAEETRCKPYEARSR